MIAKRIRRQGATSSITRLVRYMVAAQGGMDPSLWKRTPDYEIDSKATTQQGEKVQSYRVTHCGTDDLAVAAMLIEATQAYNTRSRSDKTYHLVFSFSPGEEPPRDLLHAIEDELCASIGFADHQRISAVHIDTDHLHVHVAINKVHPTGHQNIEPFYDKQKLMAACERLEIEYGLQRTHHGVEATEISSRSTSATPERVDSPPTQASSNDGDNKSVTASRQRVSDMTTHTGINSLERYVIEKISDEIRCATSWQAIHAALVTHSLEIKPRGAGLVIGDAEQNVWCKASRCGRDMSLKALTERLGPFMALPDADGSSAKQRYTPRPISHHPASGALFAEYQRQQRAARESRNKGLSAIRREQTMTAQSILADATRQRALVKILPKGSSKKSLYANITGQAQSQRMASKTLAAQQHRTLIQRTTLPTWNAWLMQRAENGDVDALAVLRFRAEREEKFRGDLLTADKAENARHIIMASLKPQARKDGTMAYRTADGGLLLDRVDHVQVKQATAGAALVAISLAAERFEGQPLVVQGSPKFRADVARLAALHRINVTFSDAEMEQCRVATLSEVTHAAPPQASNASPTRRTPQQYIDNNVKQTKSHLAEKGDDIEI